MELPMVRLPGCSLDGEALSSQISRCRQLGCHATVLSQTPRRVIVDLDETVDVAIVEAAIATEANCCAFLQIAWDPQDATARLRGR
jgi:hypothetical protein